MNRYIKTLGAAGLAFCAVLAGAGVILSNSGNAANTTDLQLVVNADGSLHLPDIDYRKDWVALGSWSVAADDEGEGAQGIHAVYTQPGTVEAFRKSGKFPDGAILIKELFSTNSQDMTTGFVSRANQTSGWFLMVKDTQSRYPDNKLWGDGWAWSYFDADDRMNATTTDYKDECLGCHEPVRNQDWVYTQGYPVLTGR